VRQNAKYLNGWNKKRLISAGGHLKAKADGEHSFRNAMQEMAHALAVFEFFHLQSHWSISEERKSHAKATRFE
jgi:hypothetical protein